MVTFPKDEDILNDEVPLTPRTANSETSLDNRTMSSETSEGPGTPFISSPGSAASQESTQKLRQNDSPILPAKGVSDAGWHGEEVQVSGAKSSDVSESDGGEVGIRHGSETKNRDRDDGEAKSNRLWNAKKSKARKTVRFDDIHKDDEALAVPSTSTISRPTTGKRSCISPPRTRSHDIVRFISLCM
jgi:hypothetical protein